MLSNGPRGPEAGVVPDGGVPSSGVELDEPQDRFLGGSETGTLNYFEDKENLTERQQRIRDLGEQGLSDLEEDPDNDLIAEVAEEEFRRWEEDQRRDT